MNAVVNVHMTKTTLLLNVCVSDQQHNLQKALYSTIMNMISELTRFTKVTIILLDKKVDISARNKKKATSLNSAVMRF